MNPARASLPTDLSMALAAAHDALDGFASTVHYYAVAGSTNDIAAEFARAGAADGTVVVADAQTAGRGRNGRGWFSPPGAGLYVSIILRPTAVDAFATGAPPWARLITLAAGVALATGLRTATGLPVDVKWPNDIVVADSQAPTAAGRRWRKIAGILAEGQTFDGVLQHVVLGYGINLQAAAYPPDIADRASSLEAELGRGVERAPVLVQTLAALRREYDALLTGDATGVLDRWQALAPSSHGTRVSWTQGGTAHEGTTAGIDQEGALVVIEGPLAWHVTAGEVVWV